jgi:DNA topoisomerase-3
MRLFIAEKPAVADVIAKGLGGGRKENGKYTCGDDVVTWCFGHMIELAMPDHYLPDEVPLNSKGNKVWRFDDLPIIPGNWKLQPKQTAKKQLDVVKKLLKSCDVVVNCGDIDRAGQNIVDEVVDYYNFKGKQLRYWCAAMDSVSVKKALADLKPNDDFRSKGDAEFARCCADWLIGMNLSRAFTLANRASGGASLLTVGRVQSPTLRVVVERDRAIENFQPKPYFKVSAMVRVDDDTPPYKAVWVPSGSQAGLDDESRLIDADVAASLACDGVTGEIVERSVQPKTQRPPVCYSLSDLQFSASKLFGYDAEKTLNICQALYERHKVVTYPRVDTGYLPESIFAEARQMMDSIIMVASTAYSGLILKADLSIKSKTWDDSKVSAHHGIVPTPSADTDIGNLSEEEQNIYDLIVRRFIAQFYPPFKYEQTTILHKFNGEKFKASGRIIIDQGWKEVVAFEANAVQEKSKDEGVILPMVTDGQLVTADIKQDRAKTTPPKRFTDGDLIKAMQKMHLHIDDPEMRKLLKESEGLGTEATRASIISELKRRNFLKVEKKNLISTAIAREIIDILPSDVTSPLLSARAEERLSQIEEGALDKYQFIKEQADFVSSHVEAVKNDKVVVSLSSDVAEKKEKPAAPMCPNCKTRELMRRPNKNKKNEFFWMCKGVFDEKDQCKSFFNDVKGKPQFKKAN